MRESIKYSVTEMKNLMRPEDAPKGYARIQHQKTLSLEDLADHIVGHGSPFSSGSIEGILIDMTKCIGEALSEGNNVNLGRLGVLKTAITCEGSEAGTDKDGNHKTAAEMFTAANIKGLNVNFMSGERLLAELAKASFEPTITRAAQAAALRAEKKGQKSADWTKPEEQDGNDEP